MTRRTLTIAAGLSILVPACGSQGPTPGDASSSAGSTETSVHSTSTGTSSTGATSTAGAPTSEDSGNFVGSPDLPAPGLPCDPWQESCPAGQKCKPRAAGQGPWVEANCVAVADPPTPTGGACVEPEWSYADECERGAVCHGFLGDEPGRRCHGLCSGSPTEPACTDACSWCFANGEVAGVCLLPCDPREHECPEGQSCHVLADAPRFLCTPGPGSSAVGEACAGPDSCAEGTACVDAALVQNCAGDTCCAAVCDLDGPETCAATLPATTCAPWPVKGQDFEPSCLPDGLGLCVGP